MGKRIHYPLNIWVDEAGYWIASKGHHDKIAFLEGAKKYHKEYDYYLPEKYLTIENVRHGWYKKSIEDYDGDWYYDECERSDKGSIPITFIEL